jgi:hypothetical protein
VNAFLLELLDLARILSYDNQSSDGLSCFPRQIQAGFTKPSRFHDRKRHLAGGHDLACPRWSFRQLHGVAGRSEYSGQICPQSHITCCDEHPVLHVSTSRMQIPARPLEASPVYTPATFRTSACNSGMLPMFCGK